MDRLSGFTALKQIAVTDEPFSDAISYAYDANSYESFLNFPLYVSANINIRENPASSSEESNFANPAKRFSEGIHIFWAE